MASCCRLVSGGVARKRSVERGDIAGSLNDDPEGEQGHAPASAVDVPARSRVCRHGLRVPVPRLPAEALLHGGWVSSRLTRDMSVEDVLANEPQAAKFEKATDEIDPDEWARTPDVVTSAAEYPARPSRRGRASFRGPLVAQTPRSWFPDHAIGGRPDMGCDGPLLA